MNESRKTIMILGAGQLQIPILQRAKERGLRTVVVSPESNQPGCRYADVIVPLDVRDEIGILKAAEENHIDGVTTDQTDLPVRTAAYISERMGLPGISYELGCLFTDKYKQREKCKELGISVPRFTKVRTSEEAEQFYKECKTPVVMKPIDSQASHGVSKVIDESQIHTFFHEAAGYGRSGEVIMEEFIDGIEFSVDCYVGGGTVNKLALGEYHPFKIDGAFSSAYTVFPPDRPSNYVDRILRMNESIIKGFCYERGRTHAEYLVNDSQCCLIEIAARGGGAYFSSDNVRYVSGFCSEDYLINIALGLNTENIPQSNERHDCCCTLFFYLPENGVVSSVEGVDLVQSLNFVRRNNLNQIKIGTETKPIIDKGTRYFMILVAENYADLYERMNIIRELLLVKTRLSDGRELLPIWE